jgi:hypothetical protein
VVDRGIRDGFKVQCRHSSGRHTQMVRAATTVPSIMLGLGIACVAASVYGRCPGRADAPEAQQAAVLCRNGGETGLRL